MKFIQRWGLMHNVHRENIQEHSLQVAQIAHALAVISNRYFGGEVNPERVAVLALYHDASEVITGDLPTPIKYFSPQIKEAYKEIEAIANQRLIDLLPGELQADYRPMFFPESSDAAHWDLVKAADKISAYLKCLEERKAGNQEFTRAEVMLRQTIKGIDTPEVQWFMQRFIPSMKLTLDELE